MTTSTSSQRLVAIHGTHQSAGTILETGAWTEVAIHLPKCPTHGPVAFVSYLATTAVSCYNKIQILNRIYFWMGMRHGMIKDSCPLMCIYEKTRISLCKKNILWLWFGRIGLAYPKLLPAEMKQSYLRKRAPVEQNKFKTLFHIIYFFGGGFYLKFGRDAQGEMFKWFLSFHIASSRRVNQAKTPIHHLNLNPTGAQQVSTTTLVGYC